MRKAIFPATMAAAFLIAATLIPIGGSSPALGVAGGAHQVGLVDTSQGLWYMITKDAGAFAPYFFGNPGDKPIVGDWDGDIDETPGLFRDSDGFWYGRNSHTAGPADFSCFAGNPSDVALAGDWDGDGIHTLGIYRPESQTFFLYNKQCLGNPGPPMGAAEIVMLFGNPGDTPAVGDWDGDYQDEVGLYRESTGFFYWRNSLTTGIADGQIFFGDPGDRFVAGDWGIVDGVDTPAVFRDSVLTFFFRHTLTQGIADSELAFGQSGWVPVAGDLGLSGGPPPTTSTTTTTTTTTTMAPPPGTVRNVSLGEFFFSPASITIKVGDTVRWTNGGAIAHTSTSGSGGSFPGSPNGIWSSSTLGLGSSFSRKFNSAGTFTYFCTFHPILMGTATVVVQG